MVDATCNAKGERCTEEHTTGQVSVQSTGTGSGPSLDGSSISSDELQNETRQHPTWTCIGWCEGANFNRATGGLMPRFVIDVLHGVSQVVFLANSTSGGLLLLAMLLGSPKGAMVLGLLGACCATGLTMMFGLQEEARKEGLLGYNAVLVGAGLALFVDNFMVAVLATVVAASVSALVAVLLSRVIKPHLTLSFNISILTSLALIRFMQMQGYLPGVPEKANEVVIFHGVSDFPLLDGLEFLKAVLNGVSQIFLVSGPLSGVVMLVAIGLGSPLGALCTLLGSLLATLQAALMGVSLMELEHGIWGFNAALTSLWVSFHFRSMGPTSILFLVVFVSCCTTFTWAGLDVVAEKMNGWMAAAFTLPFNVVAFFLVGVERCVLRAVSCSKGKTPEVCTEEMTTP